ncbi:hypothetical protein [Nonomuraea sediminis]|uniref:hypothetical protein n=1 Tax=Nonomuraea sediminis TaxID=2835864 RepID=UPI002029F74A|nr:hypothetical protein [Nonomuraea sediminis]
MTPYEAQDPPTVGLAVRQAQPTYHLGHRGRVRHGTAHLFPVDAEPPEAGGLRDAEGTQAAAHFVARATPHGQVETPEHLAQAPGIPHSRCQPLAVDRAQGCRRWARKMRRADVCRLYPPSDVDMRAAAARNPQMVEHFIDTRRPGHRLGQSRDRVFRPLWAPEVPRIEAELLDSPLHRRPAPA